MGLPKGSRCAWSWTSHSNSFLLGGVSAVVAVALALVVAFFAARYPSSSASIVGATYAGYALPGIVVALAMVFLATRTVPILYQTIFLLVAYAFGSCPGDRHPPIRPGSARARRRGGRPTLGDGPRAHSPD